MPLLDHFHPPLSERRHWESFHARWASSISDALNGDLLPAEYFAEAQVHVGSRVEVDVATFEETERSDESSASEGGTAVMAAPAWAPPVTATFSMPAVFPDSIEILVMSTTSGPTLIAAIELVSPANKDRPEARRAFAAKCASYLQQGIGLVIVDIVTNRVANLHNELVSMMELGEQYLIDSSATYTTAYRPVRRKESEFIQVWPGTLAVENKLPVQPLWLDKGMCVPLDLESTYSEACERSRLS
ncbi:MAG: DUF4058 family protein [Planctomycetota bacterium]|nr:DUF4058 family protein [Planctomycetota bacterium]MDA1139739.1 DUF4058 family protein [Planctomycetota bacterium]